MLGLGISAFLLFSGVKLLISDHPYRAVLHIFLGYKGLEFLEIDKHPFPYLLTIVTVSSAIGALWTAFVAPKYTQHVKLQIFVLPWICLLVTSPIWGILSSTTNPNLQFFVEHFSGAPKEVISWLAHDTNAMLGLRLGWLPALQSFPINVLSYIVFCSLLFVSRKLFSNAVSSKTLSSLNEKPA
jgi:hypothetical protein